jgi:hypothetical protein
MTAAAILNAKRLQHENARIDSTNPSTRVHELVQYLVDLKNHVTTSKGPKGSGADRSGARWYLVDAGGRREGIEPPTRGFSARFRWFQGFINQPLAATCHRLPRHTKAQSWHAQSALVTCPSQLAPVNQDAPRTPLLVKRLWLLGHNFAVFPNINRRSVHPGDFSGSTCGTAHSTTNPGSKALRFLWRLTSSGHGPRSCNLGLDSEFSYIAQ